MTINSETKRLKRERIALYILIGIIGIICFYSFATTNSIKDRFIIVLAFCLVSLFSVTVVRITFDYIESIRENFKKRENKN